MADTESETRVEVGGNYDPPKFVGLGKEELMIVAGTPFWVRVRWILFTLFWLAWLGMVAGAIVLILNAPESTDVTGSTTSDATTPQVNLDDIAAVLFNLKS